MFAPQRDPDPRRVVQFADPVLAGDGQPRLILAPAPTFFPWAETMKVKSPEAYEMTATAGAVVLATLGRPVFGWGSHDLVEARDGAMIRV
jgi:hypothetical protein